MYVCITVTFTYLHQPSLGKQEWGMEPPFQRTGTWCLRMADQLKQQEGIKATECHCNKISRLSSTLIMKTRRCVSWHVKFDIHSGVAWHGPSSALARPLEMLLGPRLGQGPTSTPSILERFMPSIWASPSTFDWRTWFGRTKINTWIRPWLCHKY